MFLSPGKWKVLQDARANSAAVTKTAGTSTGRSVLQMETRGHLHTYCYATCMSPVKHRRNHILHIMWASYYIVSFVASFDWLFCFFWTSRLCYHLIVTCVFYYGAFTRTNAKQLASGKFWECVVFINMLCPDWMVFVWHIHHRQAHQQCCRFFLISRFFCPSNLRYIMCQTHVVNNREICEQLILCFV